MSDARPAPGIQANSEKLRGDTPTLLESSQSIFLFENAETVRFHSPQQGLIDRTHYLRRHHRAAIFPRQQVCGLREKFLGPCGFKFHQAEKRLIVFSEAKIFLGVIETGEILLREI